MRTPTRPVPVRRARVGPVALALASLFVAACTGTDDSVRPSSPTTPTTAQVAPGDATADSPADAAAGDTVSPPIEDDLPASTANPRPDWLGTRVLPIDPATGFGEVQPTPPELVERRLETPDVLEPPADVTFAVAIGPVPDDVVARSTWQEACPVALADLRYVTVPFWGFDSRLHTGELLVAADAVDAVVAGFEHLHERRFPIEEMRVTRPDELDAPPTGDGNNTSAFVCRPSRDSTSWSEHAKGRAVDVNPFHNPYVKGDVVLPELASSYVDRAVTRPGMLTADDVAAFDASGWGWGGRWRSLKDHMHLSANGR